MDYKEISVKVIHDAVEAVSQLLVDNGAKGTVIEDPELINHLRLYGGWQLTDIPEQTDTEIVTVMAYYPDDEKFNERVDSIRAELDNIESRIGKYRFGELLFRQVSETDWANAWKQYFHTTHVGQSLVIKPSWENYVPKQGEHIIELDPGMAFGTGTHHTTNMCMARLEKLIRPDMTVFDVGTGSGILSIASALLGAGSIKAVDIDPVAVAVARENVAINGLSKDIDVREGDLLHGTEGQADLIIANIIADIIIMLLPDIPGKLKQGGRFLTSGIIVERSEDVKAAAEKLGLVWEATDERGGWVVMQFVKQG